jgi:replicative DNA helicase
MSLCWASVAEGTVAAIRDRRLTVDMFKGPARDVFDMIVTHFKLYGSVPTRETILLEFEIEPALIFEPDEPAAYYADAVFKRDTLNEQRKVIKNLGKALEERSPDQIHTIASQLVQIGLARANAHQSPIVNEQTNRADRWARYQGLKGSGGIRGFRTPWPQIDAETGGLKPGDLWTLAARMGVGKTLVSLAVAAFAAANQHAVVGYVTPEMSLQAMELRRDAIVYRLPYRDLLRGELTTELELEYQRRLAQPHDDQDPEAPWYFACEGRVGNVAEVEMFVREHAVNLLVIDGLYLLDDPKVNTKTPWHERVMLIVRTVKQMALRNRIPIIATAQFNRSASPGAARGGTAAVAHSDAIGQFSDVLIGLFQDDAMRASENMQLRMLKNREGRPLDLTIRWDMVGMDFGEVGAARDASAAPAQDHNANDMFGNEADY